MSDPILQAKNMDVAFGRKSILENIDLQIRRGSITGLIGPNGAGKTTLLRTIAGLIDFTGELSVLGLNPFKQREELMQDVGIIHDKPTLYSWMKVKEAIAFHKGMQPKFDESVCLAVLESTKIQMTDKIKHLSKGMKLQLHLALVLATEQKLTILDEPTLGLDMLMRKKFYTHILEAVADTEQTVLLSTHQVEEVEHILSDVIFIHNGQITLNESVSAIKEQYAIVYAPREQAPEISKLNPINQQDLLGKTAFLVKDVAEDQLQTFGEVTRPTIAELFENLSEGVEQ